MKSALIVGKNALTRFIYGFNFLFKMLFKAYLGKKSPKFFPVEPFFRMLQVKCLSKCPYFQKPTLPWKIPAYAPGCLKWLSVIPITIISMISEFCKSENSHSLLLFFSSVGKLLSKILYCTKHCPSDCLYDKNVYRRKVTFFLGEQ